MRAPLDPFSAVVDEQRRWTPEWYSWLTEVTVPIVTTVGGLPPANRNPGVRAFVTDATAITFLSVVAGGGANKVPVVSDGTAWRIG